MTKKGSHYNHKADPQYHLSNFIYLICKLDNTFADNFHLKSYTKDGIFVYGITCDNIFNLAMKYKKKPTFLSRLRQLLDQHLDDQGR